MRYDELTLPLAKAELHLNLHPQFTVLAGLSGSQRGHLIDTIVQLNRGALRGGSATLIDAGGRRQVIDATSTDPAATPIRRSPGAWKSLLTVSAEDLGLPRASDDPGRVAAKRELEANRRRAEKTRAELAAARNRQAQHREDAAALQECEAQLANLGTEADRHRHNRARALVELEQGRAILEALDASPAQIARDDRLIAATTDIQNLAEEWAEIGERLHRLNGELADQPNLQDEELANLVDVPDEIPETLTAAIAERDRLRATRTDRKVALERVLTASTTATPTDSRVLTLAALDQETLWLTHRDVLLSTEALHEAQRHEEERLFTDPAERARVEQRHEEAEAAAALADKRWLPSVLAATATACAAAMLLIADLWILFTPVLLVACIACLVVGVALPRLGLHRARQNEAKTLEAVGATDVTGYLARFNEDPDSDHWRRAEQVIDDYQAATKEWRALVGEITVADAAQLEDDVHDWVATTDTARQDRASTKLRREIDQTNSDLTSVGRRLETMLEPFGLDIHTETLAAALQDRVLAGRAARLQVARGDTEEAEAKLTHRLETELATLGFEAGSLAARISTYGRELDASAQRDRLRRQAPDRAELELRCERLRAQLSVPESPTALPPRTESDQPEPAIAELRRRHDDLARKVGEFTDPDVRDLERYLKRIEGRIAGLETSLATERGLVVANPVDHLVETLIRYRPVWPTTEQEPAPALLDDPFAATSPELKRQLLDAVVEVTRVVQVILLTDDPETLDWADGAAQRGALSLIAPMARRR